MLSSLPRLSALLLGATLTLLLALGACSKEEAAPEGNESAKASSVAEAATDDEEQPEAEDKAGDEEASAEEAPAEGAPARAKEAESTKTGSEAQGGADKARDRVAKARADEEPPAAAEPAKSTTKEGASTPDSPEAKESAGLLSPAERRKVERERRIAELKRRNEERRKARMVQVEDQRREAEVEKTVTEENASIAARSAPQAAKRVMSLRKYINQADLRKLVSNDTLVEEGGLSGIPASEGYNSVYFAPPVRSTFGVSVQVWKDKTRRDANVRFRRMRAQYANAEDTTAPTAKSFVSQFDEILTLSFANLTKRIVVSVSCSTAICKPPQLLAVAKSISAKL